MNVLPVPQNQPFWTMRVSLDGVEYVLDAVWNTRSGKWYLGLSDVDGNRLAGQQKVVCHFPLFRTCAAEGMFPGRLFALDTTSPDTETEGVDPHLTDFGTRVLLVYQPASEL